MNLFHIEYKNIIELLVMISIKYLSWLYAFIFLATATFPCYSSSTDENELDPPEIANGERLFLETRFAQLFYSYLNSGGAVNSPLPNGDPVLNRTVRFFGLPPYQIPFTKGPFAGQSINCRTCHLVDEHLDQNELGMRAYSDFASRTPIPKRQDNQLTVVRNTPNLVDATLPRKNFLLHFDGEFSSLAQLIKDTLAGRNFGWIPGEKQLAITHVCRIIKEDDGMGELASEFGGLSYIEMFSGALQKGKIVDKDFLLPEKFRIDVKTSSCDEIYNAVVMLLAAYTEDLVFAQDEDIFSPYDVFLDINNLPTKPTENETDLGYSKKLLGQISNLKKNGKLNFVTQNPNTEDGKFRFHDLPYQFTEEELHGLEIFFNQDSRDEIGTGNCIACHPAPHFTDFELHNVGIIQIEYDNIHGVGKFSRLKIPSLDERNKNKDLYLPATDKHPTRKGIFRKVATEETPNATDLGAWNIFQNDDYPLPQESIYNLICKAGEIDECKSASHALDLSIATFKTPGLRDLGHSAPFLHNGQISDLHALIGFYIAAAESNREGLMRNGAEELNDISFEGKDIHPIVLFLISLYEDYN